MSHDGVLQPQKQRGLDLVRAQAPSDFLMIRVVDADLGILLVAQTSDGV